MRPCHVTPPPAGRCPEGSKGNACSAPEGQGAARSIRHRAFSLAMRRMLFETPEAPPSPRSTCASTCTCKCRTRGTTAALAPKGHRDESHSRPGAPSCEWKPRPCPWRGARQWRRSAPDRCRSRKRSLAVGLSAFLARAGHDASPPVVGRSLCYSSERGIRVEVGVCGRTASFTVLFHSYCHRGFLPFSAGSAGRRAVSGGSTDTMWRDELSRSLRMAHSLATLAWSESSTARRMLLIVRSHMRIFCRRARAKETRAC